MLYLYAITARAPARSLGRGIFDEVIAAVPAGGLFALAGEAEGAPKNSQERLEAHHEVVMRLSSLQAVLPARFGQMAERELIIADVSARQRSLAAALRLVDGCVQMTLRVPLAGGAAPSAPTTVDELAIFGSARPTTKPAVPPVVDALRRALSSTVRAEKVQLFEGEEPFATVYQLVPKQLVDEWLAALEREKLRGNARFAATGPWPAYAFTPEA